MELMTYNIREFQNHLKQNLFDLIKDHEVREHIVRIILGFVSESKLPIKELSVDTKIINDLFEQGRCYELISRGDGYLFMCGWFPEYLKRRHGMGIDFYIERGTDSYDLALYLVTKKKISGVTPSLLSKLSDDFRGNVGKISELKERLRVKSDSMYEEGVNKNTQIPAESLKKQRIRIIEGGIDYTVKRYVNKKETEKNREMLKFQVLPGKDYQ
ncbi:MAG: hypothetical protein QXK37_05495 [Candidatus Woesearchaeota archaeon]